MTIAEQLLEWYDENRRDLPWRRDVDPYRVWVSEIMLQQTRVETVKPYFDRWLERFPDVHTLAEAGEEEVLRYWQGLGYYSRARNLHKGVREVVTSYGGQIPDTPEDISKLSGVGEYTAGAILSIAYNQRQPAVDGNVLRVFSRLFSITGDITRLQTKKAITKVVEQELPEDRPGDFNQAIMDLGSSICIPKQPRCDRCPVVGKCLAYQQGCQDALPVRKKSTPPVEVLLVAAVIEVEGRFLLRRRPPQGLLASMWEFPALEVADYGGGLMELEALVAEAGLVVKAELQPLVQLVHTFSHRQWFIAFYRCAVLEMTVSSDLPGMVWRSPSDWDELPFAGPHQKVAELLACQYDGSMNRYVQGILG